MSGYADARACWRYVGLVEDIIDIDRVIACAVTDDFLPPAKDGSVQLTLPA